jgi:hypothetical protein
VIRQGNGKKDRFVPIGELHAQLNSMSPPAPSFSLNRHT